MTVVLTHNRVQLALHCLREGDGSTLLVLHGLGERAPAAAPAYLDPWTGPVFALDFTGHGASTVPRGGGYTAEVLMGDADIALAATGAATVLGRGLGAYVALLIAGARPDLVHGAILADGPGISGGSSGPGSPHVPYVDRDAHAPPDPYAMAELSRDIRPPDYASTFARLASASSAVDPPIAVCAVNRPEWLAAVVDEPGVAEVSLAEALALYAAPGQHP